MKKAAALFLTLLLVLTSAMACAEVARSKGGVDLSGMSYDELVALKDQINLAIWASDEWQEVTVPQGVYEVGSDIPAGHWTIKPADGMRVSVKWGDELDEGGRDLGFGGSIYEYEYLTSESYKYFEASDKTEVDFNLKDGQYFIVDDGQAVFMPYSGKPALNFK